MRVLVVQWNYAGARRRAARLREAGHQVSVESTDPGAAYRAARATAPDVIVLDLAYRAARSRRTARALHRSLDHRLIFVGGDLLDRSAWNAESVGAIALSSDHSPPRLHSGQAPYGRFVTDDQLLAALRTAPPDTP